MSMSAQEYDSAPNAPEEDGPPMHPDTMAKFEEMFGDLLLEVKEGRLSQEEGVQAMERRMQAFQSSIQASPHRSAAARRLLSVDTDECVAVIGKSGVDGATLPYISDETFAALNAVISGPPSTPDQRAKWPRPSETEPIATCKLINDAAGRPALCLAFASEVDARIWVWKMWAPASYRPLTG